MNDINSTGIQPDINAGNTVFALDVGTGTIVGVAGVHENGFFRVLAADVYEYDNRVMFDGQIHDINQVARAIAGVRDRLVKSVGRPLNSAYIAAAGRALKTVRTEARRSLETGREIDEILLRKIENEAIDKARETVAGDYTQGAFEYVGYAVTGAYLDGYPMSNLLGHSGVDVKLELITTFLPNTVIDSLFAVMRKAGISVAGLMLEPDAALNAVVKRENRRLNLALVDIGAGTSDIAITRNGNIFAYDMVPFAGDKITERICEHFLTDFKTGETVKIAMYENLEEIKFIDIFDREITVSYDEVYDAVMPVVKEMAEKISDAILYDNKIPPAAVIVVGGGSRLPGLDIRLAEALGISCDRVAPRDRNAVIGLECDLSILTGPESITPFGIALSSAGGNFFYYDYMIVRLNGKPVRLPYSNEIDVAGVLAAAAFPPAGLVYKPGKPVSFFINGLYRTENGGEGRPASVYVNGQAALSSTVVQIGDDITVTDAEDGADAKVFVSDLAPHIDAGTVTCAEAEYFIAPHATINGKICALSAEVREGDRVELTTQTTVRMFIDEYLNGETGTEYFVNKEKVDENYILTPGDEIVILHDETADDFTDHTEHTDLTEYPDEPAPFDAPVPQPEPAQEPDAEDKLREDENADPPRTDEAEAVDDADTTDAETEQTGTDQAADNDYFSHNVEINGEFIEVYTKTPRLLLVDVLNHIVFEHPDGQGRLSLRINGTPAKLTDELNAGDKILIGLITDNSI